MFSIGEGLPSLSQPSALLVRIYFKEHSEKSVGGKPALELLDRFAVPDAFNNEHAHFLRHVLKQGINERFPPPGNELQADGLKGGTIERLALAPRAVAYYIAEAAHSHIRKLLG